jgi:FkbM family methyltransferase
MTVLENQPIPPWLLREVEEYFVPLPFAPATVLDIGANIGAFARRALAEWPGCRVICCEPMPFNVSRLRRNVPPGVIIHSAAVRSFNGVDEIRIGDNFATGGFVDFGRQSDRRLMVECVAAADLPSCELVKIDTEGCEVEILGSLDLSSTRAVFVEHHSRADAGAIRAMMDGDFTLAKGDGQADFGTFAFLRKPDRSGAVRSGDG